MLYFEETLLIKMLKRERQTYILPQVHLYNKALCTALCQAIIVPDVTIRCDLHEPAETRKIIKVHGGAVSNSLHKRHPSFTEVYSCHQKQTIAKKATSLIIGRKAISRIKQVYKLADIDILLTELPPSDPVLALYTEAVGIKV